MRSMLSAPQRLSHCGDGGQDRIGAPSCCSACSPFSLSTRSGTRNSGSVGWLVLTWILAEGDDRRSVFIAKRLVPVALFLSLFSVVYYFSGVDERGFHLPMNTRIGYLSRTYGSVLFWGCIVVSLFLTRKELFNARWVMPQDQVLGSDPSLGPCPDNQHSITFTARPPWLVSLYLVDMSKPVWRMVSIT